MCHSSSSVLVLNRTSPSLLRTFVAYTTQLSIAIQHTRNSFLNPQIPRKRLRASSCYYYIVTEIVISEKENSLEDSDVNTEIDSGDKISRNDRFHHDYYFPERLECSN